MAYNDHNIVTHISLQDALTETPSKEVVVTDVAAIEDDARSGRSEGGRSTKVPVTMKLVAVLLVSLVGFGSHWSAGVTSAMKTTLKKVSNQRRTIPPLFLPADIDTRSSTSTTRNTLSSKHPQTL